MKINNHTISFPLIIILLILAGLLLSSVAPLTRISMPYFYHLMGDRMTVQERKDFEATRIIIRKMFNMCEDVSFNVVDAHMRYDQVFCTGHNGEYQSVGFIPGSHVASRERFYRAHGYYPKN